MRYKNTDAVPIKENLRKWVPFNDEWFNYFYCSECGFKDFNGENEKCPHCGAILCGRRTA